MKLLIAFILGVVACSLVARLRMLREGGAW